MSITEVAIKRPLLITVIFVTLILFGFVSYKHLNYNLLPKFEANVLMVQTTYRGASPEVMLKQNVKATDAQRDAERRIDQARRLLPEDADDPVVQRFSTDEIPILRLSVSSNLSPGALYDLLEDRVAPMLRNVSGVGSVSLIGAQERAIQVVMDNDKLKAWGISAGEVARAVAGNSATFPAGNVETGADRLHQPGCPCDRRGRIAGHRGAGRP